MLELKHLTVRYGEHTVLDDVSCAIETGTVTLLTGESGSGKTTLLNYLTLQKINEEADYYLNGKRLNYRNAKKIAYIQNQIMTYVGQDFVLLNTSVEKNLKAFYAMNPKNRKKKISRKQIEKWLNAVNLDVQLRRSKVQNLSGGERQRLALACALAKNTPVLILDEPASNLDSENQRIMAEVVSQMAKLDKTIIISTHHPDLYQPDVILHVENQKVTAQKRSSVSAKKHPSLRYQRKQPAYLSILKWIYPVRDVVLTLVIALGISLSCYLMMLGNDNIASQISAYKANTSKELLISYPLFEDSGLGNLSVGTPVSEETISDIRQMDHVVSVYPYAMFAGSTAVLDQEARFASQEAFRWLELESADGSIQTFDLYEGFQDSQEWMGAPAVLAFDEANQSQELDDVQSDIEEGIYLSQTIAEKWGIRDVDGLRIRMQVGVPIATKENIIAQGSSDTAMIEQKSQAALEVLYAIDMPVKGIKRIDLAETYGVVYTHHFYLDYQIMQRIMETCRQNSQEMLDMYTHYRDHFPEEDWVRYEDNPLLDEQWDPPVRMVYVDDILAIEPVSQQIQALDDKLNVVGLSPEVNQAYQQLLNTQNRNRLLSIGVGLILILITALLKAFLFLRDKDNREVLRLNGISLDGMMDHRLRIEGIFELLLSASLITLIIEKFNQNFNIGLEGPTMNFNSWSWEGAGLLMAELLLIYGCSRLACRWVLKRRSRK